MGMGFAPAPATSRPETNGYAGGAVDGEDDDEDDEDDADEDVDGTSQQPFHSTLRELKIIPQTEASRMYTIP